MKTTQNTASNHSTSGRTSRLARKLFCSLAIAAGFVSSAQAVDLTPTIIGNRGDGKTVAKFLTTGTGTWTIPAGVTEVEVLVVGGGGGGGFWTGGGGGGGLYASSAYAVTAGTPVTVTVGVGGAKNENYQAAASPGTESVFGSLTANGGMGGTSAAGGASGTNNQGGTGFAGGTDTGAGGGAGEAGDNGWYAAPNNNGGDGVASAITGTSTYYAGGGSALYNGALGGLGGGGSTMDDNNGGIANPNGLDGLGGGGAAARNAGTEAGKGGSGVVMVAYTSSATFYTVSFNSNEGSTVSDQSVESGSTATLPDPAPTKVGSTFVEWCSDEALTTAFNFSTPITGATTLYAKWVTNWVVTFDSTGGSAVSAQSVSPGGTATTPTPPPTWLGHTFEGWYTEVELTNLFSFSTAITADTTLYAKWTTDWVVTFDSNSGSAVDPQYVYPGGTATTPTPPTWLGHTFEGWYTEVELTNLFDFGTAITADRTLYAKWTTDWVVTFNSDGGSSVTTQYVYPGATATLPTAPTKTGHAFDGWYAESGLLNVFDFGTAITADTTIYAKWTINSYKLTYSAGANGSLVGGSPQEQNVNYGGNGTAVTATADSLYQFASWSDGKLANPRSDLNVAANITVTANFELIPPPFVPDSTVVRGDGKTVATFSTVGHGPWTIPAGVTEVEVLVVGGGGASDNWAGGSGAGGMYYSNSYAVTGGSSVTVTIGAGGLAGASGGGNGGDGQFSQFGSLMLAYGGIHGMGYNTPGGGNQGGYSIDGGTTIVPGSAPAEPRGWGWWSGSGAGAPGTVGDSAPGGIGAPCSITGAEQYYAGGGGSNANSAPGGLGGGGDGASIMGGPSNPGAPNTGGGAGGGWGSVPGADGGSGVVIVAYLAATGSATTTDLVSSLPTSYLNDSVTFTATVKVGGEVVASLPGTVEFKVDGVVKAASASIDSVTGVATYTTTELPLGTYDVVATYSGVTGTYLTSSATVSQTVSSTPFADWANTNITAKQPGADATPTGDPDGDGSNNLSEYAFAGDPLSGTDNPKVLSEVKTVDGRAGNELVLTVAVLDVPGDFVAAGDGLSLTASSASGGITYTIEGSDNLVFPGAAVTEVSAPLTLDPLPDGYAYRSFVLTDGGLVGKGFLRAKAVK